MAHAHGKMMGRRFSKPGVHVAVRVPFEPDRRLGIANGHNGAVGGLRLGDDKLQLTIDGLGAVQVGDRARLDLGLHGYASALLAMV